VDWDEKGHNLLCSLMSHWPESQNRAPKVRRIVTTTAYPSVEVGAYHHGFHCQIATNEQTQQCYLGSY